MQVHRARTPRRAASAVIPALAAIALLAGCGSSDDTATSTAATAAPSSTQPSTSASGGDASATLKQLFEGTEAPPPTTGPPPAKGKTVWWISCGEAAPACSVPSKAAGQAAKVLGFNFKVADGKLNVGGGYAAAIRQAVAARPDAIIVHSMDCDVVRQPLEEAKAAGVKAMAVEQPSCPADNNPYTAEMQYSPKAPTATDYFENWGKFSAAYLAATNPDAKVIDSRMTSDLGALIEAGFTKELSGCSGCSIDKTVTYGISDLVPNGAWINGFRTALLQSNGDAALMPFGVQMLALGGVKAVKESGKTIEIVGGNGESDTMDFVRSGDVAACTGCHDSSWMAWGAMDNVNRILNGEPTVPEGIGQRVVDKAHVDQVSAGPGQPYKSPIDWQAAYEKLWSAG
jgi:ribose transport system substrate-binding protein